MNIFQINEKLLSQIPALQLLIGLGFEFLTLKTLLKRCYTGGKAQEL